MLSVPRAKAGMALTKRDNSVSSLRPLAFAIVFALACALIMSAPAFPQPPPTPVPLAEKVLLPEAARHFGVATSWKPAEWKLSLINEEHRAEILIGSNRVMVDEQLVILSEPVTARDGAISIPLADSATLFSRLLGREVTEREISSAGLTLHQRPETIESNLIRSVRYISYPRFTRLIINISADRTVNDIEARCLEGARTLTVELPRSRFVKLGEPIEVGDRIVELIESVQTRTDAKLIVRTAAEEVKYEIQRHDDPPRVVVDISPASPTIVTDRFGTRTLPPQTNGWTEPEPVIHREQLPFTTVVIDPGHGGKDHGASGRGGLAEKEVTLDIALKLKNLIEEKNGIKVVLTRTGDYFVSLKERTAIANKAKECMPADLFISIHTNAHRSSKIGGFEAYYISDAMDPESEATAALENAVIEFERDVNGENDSMGSSLIPILWDLQFTEFVSQSSEFASMAQRELGKRLNTRNRGVRQAQFIVLAGVAMPSILIEVGFISNRVEEAKMKTADFRNRCAEALAAAIAGLKERHEIRLGRLDRKSNP